MLSHSLLSQNPSGQCGHDQHCQISPSTRVEAAQIVYRKISVGDLSLGHGMLGHL